MSSQLSLTALRTDPLMHWIGLVVAIGLGLALSTVHWLGLVVGGALLGIASTTLTRALLAGLGFGVAVLSIWASYLFVIRELEAVVATGQFAGIAVLIGVLGPVLGSLVRGVV